MIWRVPFRICGYMEVEARDADEAWEGVHDIRLSDLADQRSATVDFEVPECQD